ncbi:hypothetical protein ACIQPQ_31000 [Streptomyces sp. NPDC091281]|uniref:hypothetical protein n=1 Tax=Streptomyces sp. NPDC091281 TaxID=3365985 RepID=UPI00380C3A8B
MTSEIFNQTHGRTISSYDLLDETQERYGLSRTDAHDAIHAMLDGIIETDGDTVILERRPARPELLASNTADVDVHHWLVVSDETAAEIREALAAVYA